MKAIGELDMPKSRPYSGILMEHLSSARIIVCRRTAAADADIMNFINYVVIMKPFLSD